MNGVGRDPQVGGAEEEGRDALVVRVDGVLWVWERWEPSQDHEAEEWCEVTGLWCRGWHKMSQLEGLPCPLHRVRGQCRKDGGQFEGSETYLGTRWWWHGPRWSKDKKGKNSGHVFKGSRQDMLTDSWWNMRENRSQGWLPRTWRMKLLFKEMWWLNSACMCLPWKVGKWPLDQVSWGEGVDSLTSAQIHHGRGDGLTGQGEFRPTNRRQGPPWSPGHSQDEESKVVSGQAHRKLMTDWFSRSHAKFLTPENWPPAFDKGNNPFGVRLFEITNLNWT